MFLIAIEVAEALVYGVVFHVVYGLAQYAGNSLAHSGI